MKHLLLVYQIFVCLSGSLALGLLWIHRRLRPYSRSLFHFFGIFTLDLFVSLIRHYLSYHLENPPRSVIFILLGVTLVLHYGVILLIYRVVLSLSEKDGGKKRWFLPLALLAGVILASPPLGVEYQWGAESFSYNLGYYPAVILYLGCFVYCIVLLVLQVKRSQEKSDRWLSILLAGFALLGLLESLLNLILDFQTVSFPIIPDEPGFFISSLPYLILAILLLIHLGSLTRKRLENTPPQSLENFGFSERELEVIELLQQGKSNKEIAESLFISLSTVKTHLSRIFSKAEVNSRLELVQKLK